MQNRAEKRRRRPQEIKLGDEELTIVWLDGQESHHSLEELRLGCPCAECGEARGQPHGPQLVGNELPLVTSSSVTPTSKANGFEPVGRYGIKIRWLDGHEAGIYTFEALRRALDG